MRATKFCVVPTLFWPSLIPRPHPAFRHLQYNFLFACGESLGPPVFDRWQLKWKQQRVMNKTRLPVKFEFSCCWNSYMHAYLVNLRMCTCACGYDNDDTTRSLLYLKACLLAARHLVPAGSLPRINEHHLIHSLTPCAASVLGLIRRRQPDLCGCATGGYVSICLPTTYTVVSLS